ncbi:MAG: hypothetical protein VCG02_08015 [Verrucomicrobiota bacterium]
MDPQAPAEPTPAPDALPPQPQAKPLAPKVFGIIHLVFGIMGLLGGLFGIAMLKVSLGQLDLEGPGLAWMKISAFMGPLPGILLIVAGIGLLSYKRYGRTLSIAYGFLGLLFGVVGMIMTFTFVMPGMMAQQIQNDAALGSFQAADPIQIGRIMGLVGGLMGMIYPLVLVIFFLRPKSKVGLD